MADTLFAVTLMGPTASGKTDLALELVDRHPFEIISVDSAMVYRTMDIGTAKPSPDILARYAHHLIDICDPAEPYSAAAFRRDAIAAAEDIFERGKIPLLVGGTMLYFKALKEGLADLPSADEAVRAKIQALADSEGWPAVHARLSEVDPEAAARLDQNDSSRLQRALEIYEVSGTPMSELHKQETKPCPFPMVEFAIFPEDRAALHEAIARRFRAMLETGLIEEVRHLYERSDLTADTPSMKAVGYRQVWEFLRGDFSEDELAERGIIATRQLAKRQFTWLRSWRDQTVLPAPDVAPVLKKLGAGSIL